MSRLDADREHELVFESQLAEATERSLHVADGADAKRSQVSDEHVPDVIPPDDVLQVASTSATTRPATRTAGSSAHVVPPDVPHVCPIPGCRRRPLSDPRGLQQISQDLCCDTCVCSPMGVLTPPSVTPPIVRLPLFLLPLLQAVATVVAAVVLLHMSAHQAFNIFVVLRVASVVPPILSMEITHCAATNAFALMGVFTLLSVMLLTTT